MNRPLASACLVFALLALGAADGRAYVEETASPLILGPLGTSLSGLFPVESLAAGRNQINAAPAYDAMTESHDNLAGDGFYLDKKYSGGGGAVSFIRGLSPHWGVGAMAAYFSGTNKFTVSAGGPDSFSVAGLVAGNPLFSGTGSDGGGMGALTMIYDPTAAEGRFKFPVLLGVVYVNATASGQTPFTITQGPFAGQAATKTEKTKASGPAPLLGFAPEFDAWNLRWIPFFYGVLPVGGGTSYSGQVVSNGQVVLTAPPGIADSHHGIADVGLRVVYRPWGLGLTWVPPIYVPLADSRIQLYSLTWSRRF